MRLPPARATAAIGIATVAAWLLLAASGWTEQAAAIGGFVPARVSGMFTLSPAVPVWATPVSALFLHGGLFHLGLNLLMLGFCGRYVEVALGARGLVVLYLAGAYCAAAGQYLLGPLETSPMIGASGAISALLGAYALLYGERRQTVANRRLNAVVNVLWLAAAWIGLQVLVGLALSDGTTGIAIGAHIGGFLAGLALARPLLLWRYRRA